MMNTSGIPAPPEEIEALRGILAGLRLRSAVFHLYAVPGSKHEVKLVVNDVDQYVPDNTTTRLVDALTVLHQIIVDITGHMHMQVNITPMNTPRIVTEEQAPPSITSIPIPSTHIAIENTTITTMTTMTTATMSETSTPTTSTTMTEHVSTKTTKTTRTKTTYTTTTQTPIETIQQTQTTTTPSTTTYETSTETTPAPIGMETIAIIAVIIVASIAMYMLRKR